jgi:VCBS repeat-containing protein
VVEAGVRPTNAPFAGTPIATGNVLTNDVAVDFGAVKTVTGVAVGAGSTPTGSNLGATLTGIYGTLVLGADGSFTYTLNNSDTSTNALAQGQHASDIFSYTMSDSLGHNAITTLTIDVIGTNDLPVIASGAESSSLAELTNTTGSPTHDTTQPAPTGTLNFTDVDLTDTHSVGVTLQSAAWSGGPNIPAATQADLLAALQTALHDSTNSGLGSIDWTFSIADKDLDFLAQGETLQVTYNVAVTDSAGATSNIQMVTITVTGTNDVPVVTAAQATGDAIEGVAAPGPNLVTNGDFETGDFTGWSAARTVRWASCSFAGCGPRIWGPLR